MSENIISADEFSTWEPWPSAYQRVGKVIGWDHARDEFRRRLPLGSMRAAAREAFWELEDRPGSERREYEVLSPKLWEDRVPPNTANVWRTASYDFTVRGRYQSYETLCHGLRVERAGVEQILSDAGVTAAQPDSKVPESEDQVADLPRKTRHGLPSLRDDLLTEWHSLFLSAYPNGAKKPRRKVGDGHVSRSFGRSQESSRFSWRPRTR